MAEAGADLVRRAIAAFERADAAAFAECFDPQGEFLLPRNLIEGGSYIGRKRIEQAVADAHTTWKAIRFEIGDIEQTGDGLVVHARVSNAPRADGPTVEYDAAYACRLRDGRFTDWRPVES
jgi:ketosteroid isomerase-like protein